MSLLRKFFQPKEVRAVLLAIDLEEKVFARSDTVSSPVAFSVIKPEIQQLISSHPNKVVEEITNGVSPDQLAVTLIKNVSEQFLISGKYHVYRGVLSMQGQGLLSLWRYAVKKLEDGRIHDEDTTRDLTAWMREQIKEAG